MLSSILGVMRQLNREALHCLCDVEARTETPGPGATRVRGPWAVRDGLANLPCRVATTATADETTENDAARDVHEYVVTLDERQQVRHTDRLRVRGVTSGRAWELTLYVADPDSDRQSRTSTQVRASTRENP
jgi:hypothetical protein